LLVIDTIAIAEVIPQSQSATPHNKIRRPSANGKSLMNRRKMRAVKEVLCVNNNTSTAKQEHDINAEEAAEEAELLLSATSLLSALSEASPMTLSPSSSFNASNRSWSLYNLPVTETLSLPANWRFYPEQEKAEQEEDASLTTQRRGNAATPPLLCVTSEKASSSAAGPSTRSTQDDKNQINPPRRSSSPITSSPDEGDNHGKKIRVRCRLRQYLFHQLQTTVISSFTIRAPTSTAKNTGKGRSSKQ